MFTFDRRKYKDLVLYAAHMSHERRDKYFGAVKLNKILFFSDFIAYRRLGRPITGANYMKLSEGPAPREMLRVRAEMEAEGEIRLEPRQVFNYLQVTVVPQVPVIREHLSLSEEELAIVDEVLDQLAPLSAAGVSELSHREIGWKAARSKEIIPYETAWLNSGPVPLEAELTDQLPLKG